MKLGTLQFPSPPLGYTQSKTFFLTRDLLRLKVTVPSQYHYTRFLATHKQSINFCTLKMSSLINYLLNCLQIGVAQCASEWQLFICSVYQ